MTIVHRRHRNFLFWDILIPSNTTFNKIITEIHTLSLPIQFPVMSHIHSALLEVIHNAVRAHREQGISDEVSVKITVYHEELSIIITDKGGGFNLESLPCSAESPIDINKIQSHRKQYHHRRFGMGLIMVQRIFPSFSIHFYNEKENDIPYIPNKVVGTRIFMGNTHNSTIHSHTCP